MKWLMVSAFVLSTAAFAEVPGSCELKYNDKTEKNYHMSFSECASRAEYLIDLNDRGVLIKKVIVSFRSGIITSVAEVKAAR